jgi:hypothetical protein
MNAQTILGTLGSLFLAVASLSANEAPAGKKLVGYANGKPLYVNAPPKVAASAKSTQTAPQRTIRLVARPVTNRVMVGASRQCYGPASQEAYSAYGDAYSLFGFDPYVGYGYGYGYGEGHMAAHCMQRRFCVPQGPAAFPAAASRGYVNIPRHGSVGVINQAPRYAP